MREPGGAWSTLVADVRWSTGACLAAPLVPVLWVTTWLLPLLTDSGPVGVLLFFPLALLSIGLAGTLRLSFALEAAGRPALSVGEAVGASWRFLGRFLCVGLLVAPVFLPLEALAYALFDGDHATVPYVLASSFEIVVIDIMGTFVPPALALSTSRATEAIRLGWRVLREGWGQHRWHVLVPPLALQVVAAANLGSLPPVVQAGLQVVFGTAGVVLRGAVVAAWLRAVPSSPDGPSWLDGRPSPSGVAR